MANSKYEYVKSFEDEDVILRDNIIVVRIDGRDFRRFSEVHDFERPTDERALKLMNECATTVMNTYHDIVLCYGFSDEYSFVFKETAQFYRRRASKIVSLIASLFASNYATKWKEFFPEKEMRCPPSFHGWVIPCSSTKILQHYLAWRQNECHLCNLYNTCFWKLVEVGKSEEEAQEFLERTQKQEKNDLLYNEFGINYKNQPEIFRQGSCIIRNVDGTPAGRSRSKAEKFHSKNIVAASFWDGKPSLVKEVGSAKNFGKLDPEFAKSILLDKKLIPSNWIVIRIDGCHFHRFSEAHDFEKPNDKQALDLMNSCAEAVLQEFRDIIFAYGVSDEYSFVMNKESHLYQRRSSDIVSVIVSFFSSMYVMKWKDFFMQELKNPPSFDGRAVCYPSTKILRDYLTWRQVDCHINCQYNTCFWALVKSGRSKSEAQKALKGTQTREKYELLKQFGIDYNTLPDIFRQGSSIFWDVTLEDGACVERVVTEHCNIIEDIFWRAHPHMLSFKDFALLTLLRLWFGHFVILNKCIGPLLAARVVVDLTQIPQDTEVYVPSLLNLQLKHGTWM